MKKDFEKNYETDEILGKYLDSDEEAAEKRRLLNDDIIGKYMKESSAGRISEEEIREARAAAALRKARKEQEEAARRRRRRRRLTAGIVISAALVVGLGVWQQARMPVGISELTEAEAETARKNLEEARKAAQTPAVTETPAPTPEATPEPSPTPDTTYYDPADDWCLVLVDTDHPLPEGFSPEVVLIENDQYTDTRCAEALLKMLTDCRLEGHNPLVISGSRPHELQELYFTNMVDMYLAGGEDQETAEKHAAESVAVPGTSEHELGLAVDIGTTTNPDVDESQLNEPAQQWLMENCWKYGYVVRYPSEKSEITGIIFEPWHYRYVGSTAARVMHEEDLCLEEYLEKYVNKENTEDQPESSSSVLP